jgi:hypothetical protein
MFLSVDYLSRYTVYCHIERKRKKREREKERKGKRDKETDKEKREREFLPGDSLFPEQKNWRYVVSEREKRKKR